MVAEAIKAAVLLVSVAIIVCIYIFTGVHAYQATQELVVAASNPLDWIASTWAAFVIFARIAFWAIMALIATFIILLVVAASGAGIWVVQKIGQGFAYMVGVIRGQWESTGTRPSIIEATVAFKKDGSHVALGEWMAGRDEEITKQKEEIAGQNMRIKVLEKLNGIV